MSDVETKTAGDEVREPGGGATQEAPEARDDGAAPDDGASEAKEAAPEASEAEPEAPPEPSPLELLTAERDKLKDQLLRTAADFDNFRKRTRKDLELAERRGKEEVLRELLPVIDNLERAVQAAQGAADVEAIRQGVEMVLRIFEEAAARLGLERLKSVGERFDPMVHDAFQQVETDEHPPGTIIAEYQSGYRLGDKLVRPAMVVVAKAKPAAKPEEPKDQGE